MALRQRIWIDRQVQGVLIGRTVLYWTIGLIYLGLGSACFQYCRHPEWSYTQHFNAFVSSCGPWLPCLVLILPLVLFDVLRLSNQFAGPIYRLRRHLLFLVEDPMCQPLRFRQDDHWHNLIKPVNQLQAQILELHRQIAILQEEKQVLAGYATTGSNSEASAKQPSSGEAAVAEEPVAKAQLAGSSGPQT